MSQLERAMAAANARKMAGVGNESQGVVVADSDLQDRLVFSGFDIEYGELVGTSIAVADTYLQATAVLGLRGLFTSAWCDGLLTGLMLASLPPADESGVMDDTGLKG